MVEPIPGPIKFSPHEQRPPMQIVSLTLSDGRSASFYGPAFVDPEIENVEAFHIDSIRLSPFLEPPDGIPILEIQLGEEGGTKLRREENKEDDGSSHDSNDG